MGDTWWVIIICPCVNVFSLMGGVTEADVGFPTDRLDQRSTAFPQTGSNISEIDNVFVLKKLLRNKSNSCQKCNLCNTNCV